MRFALVLVFFCVLVNIPTVMAPRLRSGGPPAPDDARPPGPERGPDLAQHPTEPDVRAPHGSDLQDPATSPFSSTAAAELSNQGEHSDGSAAAHEMSGSSADEAASAGRTPTARPRRANLSAQPRKGPIFLPSRPPNLAAIGGFAAGRARRHTYLAARPGSPALRD